MKNVQRHVDPSAVTAFPLGGASTDLEAELGPCPCVLSLIESGWLDDDRAPMPAFDDQEGERLPTSLPPVIDAHVHLFPDRVFEAIWRWFKAYGWPVRYELASPAIVDFLLGRGVSRIVGLAYSHKPGMARALNSFMAALAEREPRVIGLATVLPGEPDARAILEEGFDAGLRGVKLHCHVQAFSPDAPELREIYEACVARDLPLVMHAGRQPASPHYPRDPYAICSAERVERVLLEHPKLRLSVPHLGADEFDAYERLLERHDNLWLDTTMLLADYFALEPPTRLLFTRPERIIYGTDFPNLPYAWDREVLRLARLGLPEEALALVLSGTAEEFFGLDVL